MIYYKSKTGEVYAYDEMQVDLGLADDKTLLSKEELQLHLNPPIVPLATTTQVDYIRKVAYANPLTGSDRWFAEANRLTIMGGTTAEIDEAKAQGVARYEEIQLENPWP